MKAMDSWLFLSECVKENSGQNNPFLDGKTFPLTFSDIPGCFSFISNVIPKVKSFILPLVVLWSCVVFCFISCPQMAEDMNGWTWRNAFHTHTCLAHVKGLNEISYSVSRVSLRFWSRFQIRKIDLADMGCFILDYLPLKLGEHTEDFCVACSFGMDSESDLL